MSCARAIQVMAHSEAHRDKKVLQERDGVRELRFFEEMFNVRC